MGFVVVAVGSFESNDIPHLQSVYVLNALAHNHVARLYRTAHAVRQNVVHAISEKLGFAAVVFLHQHHRYDDNHKYENQRHYHGRYGVVNFLGF